MAAAPPAQAADWAGVCRRVVGSLQAILAEHPDTEARAVETGRGEGGDLALVIDRAAEDAVFAELDLLHAAGHRFSAVSEERGAVDYGDPGVVVVIDPIDGSMNAKRGLPQHSVSIAVADGQRMSDVFFGFVHDFGPREEWMAVRGQGATLDGRPLGLEPRERRAPDGKLELVGIEAAHPRWVAEAADRLVAPIHRLRALGTIAVTLCSVAGARLDGMLSLKGCRAVDAAAAQLVVREAGGHVAFPGFEDPLGAPLDLLPHSPVVAARTPVGLAELISVLG